MSIHTLSLESLKHLDMGKANEGFAMHLKRAALDCMDRPGDVVRMTEESGIVTEFTIVSVDDEERRVTWGLPGVWEAREWKELERGAGYEVRHGEGVKV